MSKQQVSATASQSNMEKADKQNRKGDGRVCLSPPTWPSAACSRRCLPSTPRSFNLVDTLSVGVDRIQRNFEPLQRQVELWRKTQITDDTEKLIFYSAFIDGKLEAPRTLLPEVHRLY